MSRHDHQVARLTTTATALEQLALMTSICTSCFTTRCFLQLILSTETQQLHDANTWFIVVVYYALLELVPSLAILFFNRRLPRRRRSRGASGASRRTARSLFFSKAIDHSGGSDDALRASLLS